MSDRPFDKAPASAAAAAGRQGSPNVIVILNDDMGFSDLGCYGGEVRTPNLDGLAAGGLRFTQFYNTPRCSPSRASLLTGLHPHQCGIGILVEDLRPEGYAGNLNKQCVTMAEVLRPAGYATYMSGKWHVAGDYLNVNDTWPCQRGFEKFYGTIIGAGSYWDPNTLTRQNENIEHEARAKDFFYTDAISDHAAAFVRDHAQTRGNDPFFIYVAYTAPHWPLHAHEEDIARYEGRFAEGWDALREQRRQRMVEMGLIQPQWELTDRDPRAGAWEDAEHPDWEQRRMEVYAAQIDRMDQGIGRIVAALEETGQIDNTLILFVADNGACEECLGPNCGKGMAGAHIGRLETRDGRPVQYGNDPAITPGPEDTYASYGIGWANLSDTPFRKYKHWTHEGGIATPFIAHWPAGFAARGQLRHRGGQLTDIMATVLEVTGAEYPAPSYGPPTANGPYDGATLGGNDILPCEGTSLVPLFGGDPNDRGPMFWEHEGNGAMRDGKWKLVRDYPGDWELYDLEADRTEMHNLAAEHPGRLADMSAAWQAWADRCGVVPREKILEIFKRLREQNQQ